MRQAHRAPSCAGVSSLTRDDPLPQTI